MRSDNHRYELRPGETLADERRDLVVVTGASGQVGRQLARYFEPAQRLLLTGRDQAVLKADFPNFDVCDYDALAQHDLTGATFLHLAVKNNDAAGSEQEFRAANVDFLVTIASLAKSRGARRFVNLSSTHALGSRRDPYSRSKREGARTLRDLWPEGAVNLYVPAIYGDKARGRLGVLNALPGMLRRPALAAMKLISPAISVECLHAAIRDCMTIRLDPANPWSGEVYAADPVPERGISAFLKRTCDLIMALAIALFLWPIIALTALLIRIDSPGPAVFAQKRVGKDGRIFTCYKFRTMAVGAPQVATHAASSSIVTRLGRHLRRAKLDELPQIVNIFRNDMSFVGPRPCLPSQHELVAQREIRGVLAMKPGITGLAQINDIDMSDPPKLAAWDDRYGTFQTLLGDALLMAKTGLGGGLGDRVALSTPSTPV